MSRPNRLSAGSTVAERASADVASATALRERAERLVRYADAIERQRVMGLPDLAVHSAWGTSHAGMCERMLRRNLHQLHRSADELRSVAHDLCEHASRLEPIAAA